MRGHNATIITALAGTRLAVSFFQSLRTRGSHRRG